MFLLVNFCGTFCEGVFYLVYEMRLSWHKEQFCVAPLLSRGLGVIAVRPVFDNHAKDFSEPSAEVWFVY